MAENGRVSGEWGELQVIAPMPRVFGECSRSGGLARALHILANTTPVLRIRQIQQKAEHNSG